MVYTGPERREYIRVQLAISVRYSLIEAPQEYKESYTEDISSGGMKLLLRDKHSVGTLLRLQFELLREGRGVRFDTLKGRVVWVSPDPNNREYPYKAGIQFINIDADERILIGNCIYHRAELLKSPFH